MAKQILSDKAREEQRKYAREWRAQNRDKVREINRRYWERKAQMRQECGGDSIGEKED